MHRELRHRLGRQVSDKARIRADKLHTSVDADHLIHLGAAARGMRALGVMVFLQDYDDIVEPRKGSAWSARRLGRRESWGDHASDWFHQISSSDHNAARGVNAYAADNFTQQTRAKLRPHGSWEKKKAFLHGEKAADG
jgi:hypothetical protein